VANARIAAVSCSERIHPSALLIPAIEVAMKAHEKLRLYYEIGPAFDGYDSAERL
jgi:hypothetical protein